MTIHIDKATNYLDEHGKVNFKRESDMTDIVAAWIESQGMLVKREICFPWGACDLAGYNFEKDRFIAVELKLSRISEVVGQAMNNINVADESYIAMPLDVAQRAKDIKDKKDSNEKYKGLYFIGIIGINRDSCQLLSPAYKFINLRVQQVNKFKRLRKELEREARRQVLEAVK